MLWLSGKLKEFDGRGNVRNYISKKIYLYDVWNGEKRLKKLWKWKIRLSFLIDYYIVL